MKPTRFFNFALIAFATAGLVAAGCGDDDGTASSTSEGGNGSTTTTSTSTDTGNGGGDACVAADECEKCAETECNAESLACCMIDGCEELVRCAAEQCGGGDDLVCVSNECADSLATAGAEGISAGTALGECLLPALETSTDADCQACAALIGSGGAGSGGSGGN